MWKIELIRNTRSFPVPVSAEAPMQKISQLGTEH